MAYACLIDSIFAVKALLLELLASCNQLEIDACASEIWVVPWGRWWVVDLGREEGCLEMI
jgi:hypothetical protein